MIRLFLVLAPAVSTFAFSLTIARSAPPARLGVDPILWWFGVLAGASTYLLLADRFLSRYLPIAALFRVSLAFPDQAPSRFKAALRSTNSRKNLKRIESARNAGEWNEEIKHSDMLLTLVSDLSDHDRLTRGHSERVQAYCDLIAEEMDLPPEDRAKLRWGSLLHDVGKLLVPAEILNKDGRPTDDEWTVLQAHPSAGSEFVEPLRPWLGEWLGAVDQHHCRWDGTGYPSDLQGEEISLAGRITAVADAYDVMTSVRSYKDAMSSEVARRELAKGAGTQFDPEIVRAFLQIGIGKLHLVVRPLAWFAGASGSVPSSVIGPAIAGVTVIAISVGGILVGYDRAASIPELAFAEPEQPGDSPTTTTATTTTLTATTLTTTALIPTAPATSESTTTSVSTTTAAPSSSTSTSTSLTAVPSTTTAPSTTTTTTTTPSTTTAVPITTTPPTTTPPTTRPSTTRPSTTATTTTSTTAIVVNRAPIPRPDKIATLEDTPVILMVMANDRDPDGDSLTITSISNPTSGTADVGAGGATIAYNPSADFFGADTFAYVVEDGNGGSATATVNVSVTAVNDPPMVDPLVVAVSASARPGMTIGAVSVTDIDGLDPVFSIIDQGLTDQGITEQGITDQGITDQGTFDRGSADKGAIDKGPADLFAIDPATGAIRTTGPLPAATPTSFSLTVAVFDGANTVNETVTVKVSAGEKAGRP